VRALFAIDGWLKRLRKASVLIFIFIFGIIYWAEAKISLHFAAKTEMADGACSIPEGDILVRDRPQ
jgi:hypothetical protein